MKKIAVLGGGESGTGAAILAKKNGIEVFVSDYSEIKTQYKEELINNNIPFEEKGHSFEKIEDSDLIVKSPGIPEHSEVIKHFRLRQKNIISEIEWASRFYFGQIIGVTGSNGKTTTCSMIYHILKSSGIKVGLGGNIGNSMSSLLLESEYDYLVLELSSFQLDDITEFAVDIGVILNITADHLDRYDYDIEKYADAKWKLVHSIKEGGHCILNEDDSLSMKRLKESNAFNLQMLSAKFPMTSLPSKEGSGPFEIRLRGRHNLFNAAVAITVGRISGVSDHHIANALLTFKAVEHRLEYVIEHDDVEYINDSKATNVDSTMYALEAMERPVIWIVGGTDKGNDYSVLKSEVSNKVKAMICLCEDDSKLLEAFRQKVDNIYSTKSMEDAVDLAIKNADKGDVILLSPACASFDLFDNYEHRGREFKNAVLNYISEGTN